MALLQMAERVSCRLAIQILCLFGDLRHRSEARQPRHAAGDRGAESVDGLDAELGGVLREVPPAQPVVLPVHFAQSETSCARARLPAPLPADAARNASTTRERISPAAFRVNVIATTASGDSTVSSSFR